MKKTFPFLLIILMFLQFASVNAQQATWIWYPGDFEIWLANHMQNRRTERGSFFPPFWKLDNHFVLMDFHKDFDLTEPEEVRIAAEGNYIVKLNGKAFQGTPSKISVPAGKNRISIKVFNQAYVPSIFVKGEKVVSDSSWLVTYEDKEWIDQSGKVSDQSGTTWLKAGSWNFNSIATPPSAFRLPVLAQPAVSIKRQANTILADFGKETFGFIKLHGVRGNGKLNIYYGESQEEALSTEHCETLDKLDINSNAAFDTVLDLSKAFRYVNVQFDPSVKVDSVSYLYEYAPL
ncbi:MAG TPA: alpha-rhamnosidase, partial [Chitinophagaceae bacterium]